MIENKKIISKEVKTVYRERNHYISEFTKERARGIGFVKDVFCGEESTEGCLEVWN